MFNWLKKLSTVSPTPEANTAARTELNRIRRDELSVGAHMRQGKPVSTFPGLASGAEVRKSQQSASRLTPSDGARDIARRDSGDGDFTTSAVVAGATGSTLAGLVMGGSFTGAIVGAAVHEELSSSSCDPSPEPSSETNCSDF